MTCQYCDGKGLVAIFRNAGNTREMVLPYHSARTPDYQAKYPAEILTLSRCCCRAGDRKDLPAVPKWKVQQELEF